LNLFKASKLSFLRHFPINAGMGGAIGLELLPPLQFELVNPEVPKLLSSLLEKDRKSYLFLSLL